MFRLEKSAGYLVSQTTKLEDWVLVVWESTNLESRFKRWTRGVW